MSLLSRYSIRFKHFNQIANTFEVTIKTGLMKNVNKLHSMTPMISNDKVQDVLTDLLKDGSNSNWQHIRHSLLENKSLQIKEIFVNHAIFDYLFRNKDLTLAQSFCKYVTDSSGSKLNLADVSNIFNVYSEIGKNERQLGVDEINFIKDLYKKLRNDYPVLDPRTNTSALLALATLNDWQECLHIIEEINLAEVPTRAAYASTVDTLFRCGEFEKGWELLHLMLRKNRLPSSNNYISWLNFASGDAFKSKLKKLNKIERLFYFIAQNELKIDISTANRITEVFTDVLNWKVDPVKIKFKGTCSVCGDTLRNDPLTLEEYDILKKDFAEHVLIGTDIFTKSTPQEMDSFFKFLYNAPRYDMVLDALNIVTGQPSNHLKGMKMLYLLDKLRSEQRNIFILGRKHLLKIKQFPLWEKKSKITYMIDNLSNDDTFLLYAAIFGGPKTDFLSCDMMRSHTYLLREKPSELLFLRWLRHHQHMLVYCESDNVVIKRPMRYAPFPQKAIGWHIPFQEETPLEPQHVVLGVPEQWLCLKPPLMVRRK